MNLPSESNHCNPSIIISNTKKYISIKNLINLVHIAARISLIPKLAIVPIIHNVIYVDIPTLGQYIYNTKISNWSKVLKNKWVSFIIDNNIV